MAEFTWPPVIVCVLLGILFGASSLYLVLIVGDEGGTGAKTVFTGFGLAFASLTLGVMSVSRGWLLRR